MDISIVIILALTTLVVVAALAWISKARTEKRRHDSTAPKSSLATDGNSHKAVD